MSRAESTDSLSSVLEASDLGLILIDPHGVIILWNRWMARASEIDRHAAIGATLTDLFPDLAGSRVCESVDQAIERGMSALLSRSLNNSPFQLRGWTTIHEGLNRIEQMVTIKPIKTKGGRHCLIQIFDVTAAVNREKLLCDQAHETQRLAAEVHLNAVELRRSNDELEQFAYAASHDLREPLRTIASFSQMLEKQLGDRLDSNSTEYLEFIVEGAKRMDMLIAGLLEMSRVESRGKDLVVLDCNASAASAVANLTVAIEDANAVVRISELPTVMADEPQLIQLFQNLIANAIKFRGVEAPIVDLSAKRVEDRWQISVSDNGIGIDPKHTERIFKIFQRLHTRSEYPGSGIGLALCRKICERHGGSIRVDSRRETDEGTGTTFSFDLAPATTEEVKADPAVR